MSLIFRRLVDWRLRSYQQALLEKHYEEVENMYRQMRAWRHDYKNHLQVMKAHLDLGEYKELSDYISHLNQEISQIEQFIKTGDVMMDAILNSKISLARTKQIKVNVKVILPPEMSVNRYDLCVILGNLLDNAIEGCESQPAGEERILRVYIGVLEEQLYLSVTNSHKTRMKKSNGRYLSTKAVDRGLGTMSIDSLAKRNKGFVNRQNDEAIFATEILLPLS